MVVPGSHAFHWGILGSSRGLDIRACNAISNQIVAPHCCCSPWIHLQDHMQDWHLQAWQTLGMNNCSAPSSEISVVVGLHPRYRYIPKIEIYSPTSKQSWLQTS